MRFMYAWYRRVKWLQSLKPGDIVLTRYNGDEETATVEYVIPGDSTYLVKLQGVRFELNSSWLYPLDNYPD